MNIKQQLPKKLFIVGNSCAGKSSFVDHIKSIYPFYYKMDDFSVLKEIHKGNQILNGIYLSKDKELKQNKIIKFLSFVKNLKYIENIWEICNKEDFLNNKFFEKISSFDDENGGFKIQDPAVWDKALLYATKYMKNNKYSVLEFARGFNEEYCNKFKISKNQIYEKAFTIISSILDEEFKDSIIVYLYCDFNNRLQRNEDRRLKGGHYVRKKTMLATYKKEIFHFTDGLILKKDGERGFLSLSSIDIPVFFLKNETLKDYEISKFFNQKLEEILSYYINFKKEI